MTMIPPAFVRTAAGLLAAGQLIFVPVGPATGEAARPFGDPSFARQVVETPDARIAYVETGDPDGRPIVFLHGIPTSSYLWRNVLPGVEAAGRRLIATDLVGFGASKGSGYGVLEQVAHLEAFVAALDLREVVLVTHDWGAGIGILLAQRNPGLVEAFATMEGALPPVYPRPDIESFGPAAPIFARMRHPESRDRAVLIENVWIEKILPDSVVTPLDPKVLAAYRAPFPTPESRRPILDMTLSLPIGGAPAEVVSAYEAAAAWWRRTPIPKLVLYATPGRLLPKRLADWAAENLRNVTTAEVGPGVHFIQEDSPGGVARALDAWLGALPAGRAR